MSGIEFASILVRWSGDGHRIVRTSEFTGETVPRCFRALALAPGGPAWHHQQADHALEAPKQEVAAGLRA